ncbi:hypothetical protein E5288_WYG004630 [Bos mutus]|uniref:Platelet-derived growth factor (PDGF) family profile domain-containing protein n=1 Tax=Bos mutus TaxID=72004 RepID=A0A6B0RR24_9CETA|nr:hypothetical protein [Bos mutus]
MPTVRLFTCFLQLLTGLVLPAVPTTQWALSPGNISSEVEVVPFQQVWSRSYCRPVERLVDIVSEYPSEMEHLFSPSCVSLMRCTGCCSDESMHCVPLETANVTMQLMKYRSLDQPFFVEMSFSQHVRCECNRSVLTLLAYCRRRSRVRGPRKREEQKHKDCHLSSHVMGLELAKFYPVSLSLQEQTRPPRSVKLGILGRSRNDLGFGPCPFAMRPERAKVQRLQ